MSIRQPLSLAASRAFCPSFPIARDSCLSGTITVAGQSLNCATTADAVAKTAAEAMEKVNMTYLVGEKQCSCPREAEKLAQETGDVRLCVVGDQKTACSVTARLNLARAKYLAAVRATMQPQG